MKNPAYVIIFLISSLSFYSIGQTIPNVSVRALESHGNGCFNNSNPVEGVVCFDILFKVDQPNWLLYSYNIWLSYGVDNSIFSFSSEDPCYHQKGGAVDLDQFGKFRVLSANFGLPFEANKERIIHNICLDVMDFSGIDRLKLVVGGDQYGLLSSVNLVDQSNSQNAVNPVIPAKTKRLKAKNLLCLQIKPQADHICSSQGLNLLTLALDATGSTIPDDCEPFTYEWTGPNGFSSTEANPTLDFSSPSFRSGDFNVKVIGENGCEGSSTFSFNSHYCSSTSQRSSTTTFIENVNESPVTQDKLLTALDAQRMQRLSSYKASGSLNIYPNPVLADLFIKCDAKNYKSGTVTNSMGNVVQVFAVNENKFKLNMTNLPLGLYVLSLEGDGPSFSKSILKL